MPSWDKSKQAAYYNKKRDELKIKRRKLRKADVNDQRREALEKLKKEGVAL